MIHTLKVTLKQHTPLIHFQHDQDGATLRASEVKPKLDRYIIQRVFNNNYDKCKEYLVGYDKQKPDKLREKFNSGYRALDYKMRIEAEDLEAWDINEPQRYTTRHRERNKPFVQKGQDRYLAKIRNTDGKTIMDLKSYPLFFANLDADYNNLDEYRRFRFTDTPLVMSLMVVNDTLYDYINDVDLLNDFFFQRNFGTRQSKGFGSFGIDKHDPLYRERKSNYRFCLQFNEVGIEKETESLFKYIELFYKTLRGGINKKDRNRQTEFYFKSLAYRYAHDFLQAKWDKRSVKEAFYGIDREQMPNTFDVRDMLGFSTNEQWQSYGDSIEKISEVADRMQSPILFKPIYEEDSANYTINILFQDSIVNMDGFKNGEQIIIQSKRKRDREGNNKTIRINIPRSFSTSDYFDFIFNRNRLNFDISTHVEQQYQNHNYYAILEDIYTQIKENLQ